MALTYVFYRSDQIGTGTLHDPYRSKLDDYVVADGTGTDFWDIIHDARPIRYALARADSSVHEAIRADAGIAAFSPEMSDLDGINAWLDGVVPDLPQAVIDTLESDGISTAWVTSATTRRQLMRYLVRILAATQDIRRLIDRLEATDDAMDLFRRALTLSVNQIPTATRQSAASWLQSKGLDTGWISGTTTVRQVIQFALENLDWPVMRLGPARFD